MKPHRPFPFLALAALAFCALPAAAHVTVSGVIDAPTTWGRTSPAADGIYWVTSTVTVRDGGSLTIEPGVIVKFDPGQSLQVGASTAGTLDAQGTASEPIVFTSIAHDLRADTNGDGAGTSPTPGDWNHLYFYTGGTGILDYCEIRYSGSTSLGGLYCYAAGAAPTQVTNCSFADNADWPVRIYPADVQALGTGNTFGGNAFGGVLVRAGSLSAIVHTWTAQPVAYYIDGDLTIPVDATLNLPAGCVLKMDGATRVYLNQGTLNAQGASGNPVIFTSLSDDTALGDTGGDGATVGAPGDWEHFYFYNGAGGILDWTEIRFAGRTNLVPVYCYTGNPSQITNCTISDCASLGLSCAQGYAPATLSANTFANNGTFPIMMYPDDAHLVAADNVFAGNGNQAVYLNAGDATGAGVTWNDLGIPWYLAGSLTVTSGATVNIAQGNVLKIKDPWEIVVNGTLNAIGTGAEPIVFTSFYDDANGGDTNNDGSTTSPAAGDWDYIQFRTGCDGIFRHCDILYGGGHASYPQAVYFNTGTLSEISDCTVSDSLHRGISTNNSGLFPATFSGNHIANCATWPLRLYPDDVAKISADNTFAGNANQAVLVLSATLAAGTHDWKTLPVPFYISGDLTVGTGATLNLGPGCVLKFDPNEPLAVTNGTLNAQGASGDPVIFTSWYDDTVLGDSNGDGSATVPSPGDWYYVRYSGTGTGILDWCTMRYGGGHATYPQIIDIRASTPTQITNCVLEYAQTYGIQSIAGGLFPATFTGNTIRECGTWPLSLYARDAGAIDASNAFTNNGRTGVRVVGENLPSPGSYTWQKLDVPYFLTTDLTVPTGATFTPQPGTILKFNGDSLYINGGTLDAQGTELDPIVFTSFLDDAHGGDTNGDGSATSPGPGGWRYVRFAAGGPSTMDHCEVRYAGSYSTYPFSIWVQTGNLDQLTNCLITDGTTQGINCWSGYGPSLISGCAIENHDEWPIVMDPSFAAAIASDNTFTNNGNQAVYLRGETLSAGTPTAITWNPISVPFWLYGGLTVGSNVTLNPGAGNILKINGGQSIAVDGGTLNLPGTAGQPITITSYRDDGAGGDTNGDGTATTPTPGDWNYIRFNNGGTGTWSYADIRYGGGYSTYPYMIWSYSGAPAALDHCTLEWSDKVAFRTQWASTATVFTNCVLRDNDKAFRILDGNPVIGGTSGQGNDIYSNATYGVENTSGLCIDARYNYWGADDGPDDPSAAADVCLLADNLGSGDAVTDDVDYTGYVGSPTAPPEPPTPLTPASPSEVNTATPTLTVTNSISSGTLLYRFQVARNTSFDTGLQEELVSPGTGTTAWTVPSALNENTIHYWRCRAEDQDSGLPSSWTDTWRFYVNAVNDQPNTPSLNSPANNAQVFTYTPTLVCNNTTDPDDNESMDYPLTYEFEVYEDSGLTLLVDSQAGVAEGAGTTAWTTAVSLSENTQYWWHARAHDGVQSGNWSGTRSFFVTVVNEAPGAPSLYSPAEGATVTGLQPVLYVNNADDPDRDSPLTYDFEVYDDLAMTNLVAFTNSRSGSCCSGTTGWTVSPALERSLWHWWTSRASDAEFTGPDMAAASFFTPSFPMPETGEYGYLPAGDSQRGDRVTCTFPASAGDVIVVYEAYNIQTSLEANYRILINGTDVGDQGAACDASWSDVRQVLLPDAEVNNGTTNTVTFECQLNAPGAPVEDWGVRSVSVDVPAPDPVWAVAYNTAVDVNWAPVDGVAGYNVYRSTISGGPYSQINGALVTDHVYRDLGLTNGQPYYYVIRSESGAGIEGLDSDEASATPEAANGVTPITDLRLTKSGDDARLDWTEVSTDQGVQFYRVYRVYPPDFLRAGGSVEGEPTAPPFDHTNVLLDNDLYYYDVATVDTLDQEAAE